MAMERECAGECERACVGECERVCVGECERVCVGECERVWWFACVREGERGAVYGSCKSSASRVDWLLICKSRLRVCVWCLDGGERKEKRPGLGGGACLIYFWGARLLPGGNAFLPGGNAFLPGGGRQNGGRRRRRGLLSDTMAKLVWPRVSLYLCVFGSMGTRSKEFSDS